MENKYSKIVEKSKKHYTSKTNSESSRAKSFMQKNKSRNLIIN